MIFTEYCDRLKKMLERRGASASIVERNLEKVFDSYINNISEKQTLRTLTNTRLNENTDYRNDRLRKYTGRVIKILETLGYDRRVVMHGEILRTIAESEELEEDEYACAEICGNKLEKDNMRDGVEVTPEKVDCMQNKLIMYFHGIVHAAITKLDVSPTGAKIGMKIRLFSGIHDLETDVKSYIRNIHKLFSNFISQNFNGSDNVSIKNYEIKSNNLYCAIELRIPFVENELVVDRFNITDMSSAVASYMNVSDTFAEQYKDLRK